MDSRAEQEKGVTKWIMLLLLSRVSNSFSAQMFAPPSVYSRVRRANGTRAGPPGPYICAPIAVFALKHEHIISTNREYPYFALKGMGGGRVSCQKRQIFLAMSVLSTVSLKDVEPGP